MSPASSTSRYILTALAVILVVTAFILVGLNALNLRGRLASLAPNSYVSGYLAARDKYRMLCPLVAQPALILTGTVQSLSGSSLTVHAENLDTDPLVDGVSDTRTVTLATNAAIQRAIQKTPQQLTAEFAAHPKTPPSPVTLSVLRLSDIKAGDHVIVMSTSDVRTASSIVAVSITVK